MRGQKPNQKDKRTARRDTPDRDHTGPAEGVLNGLWAAWFKSNGPLSEPFLQRIAESIVPPSPEQKLEVGADPGGHPENMPPAVLAGRVASALGRQLTDGERLRVQEVIHYTMGAGLGVAYKGVAERWPAATRGGGALAGLAIYAGTHGSVLPALGIQRPPWRLPPAAIVWEATSHVVYGAALEVGRRAIGAAR